MNNKVKISDMFKVAFGINADIFISDKFKSISYSHIDWDEQILPDHYNPTSTSWMGTPILFPAKFKAFEYQKFNAYGEIKKVKLNELVLPPATMFQFRRAKNIVRTNISGSNGTVKEIFSFDDWVIDVRGLCLDEKNKSAQNQLKELLQFEELADSIHVEGELFADKGISKVCITDWQDNLVQGGGGVVAFQFQLLSDQADEFNLLRSE